MKATIEQESSGGRIVEISRETEGGRPTYEVRIARNDLPSTLSVAPDGRIVKRGGDEDEEEDED